MASSVPQITSTGSITNVLSMQLAEQTPPSAPGANIGTLYARSSNKQAFWYPDSTYPRDFTGSFITGFSTANNTGYGLNALAAVTSGVNNFAMGANALAAVTTQNTNFAIGQSALQACTGTLNFAIGKSAGSALTTGTNNTLIGTSISVPNTVTYATAIGNNTSVQSANSIAIGHNATVSSTGVKNVVVGPYASVTGTATMSTVIGAKSTTSGSNNVIVGYNSSTTGSSSIIFGPNISNTSNKSVSILGNATGYSSVAIGYKSVASGSHSACIGYNTKDNGNSYSTVIGSGASSNVAHGLFFPTTLPSVTGTTLVFNASGQVGPQTSTQKHKLNIRDPQSSLTKNFANIKPKLYERKDTNKTELGLIAEELDQIYPQFVNKDLSGEPFSVSYDKLNILCIYKLQELKRELANINEQIALL